MTFDMRALPSAATALGDLTERDRAALRHIAEGMSAREIAELVELPEAEAYLLVAWVLEELQLAPDGER